MVLRSSRRSRRDFPRRHERDISEQETTNYEKQRRPDHTRVGAQENGTLHASDRRHEHRSGDRKDDSGRGVRHRSDKRRIRGETRVRTAVARPRRRHPWAVVGTAPCCANLHRSPARRRVGDLHHQAEQNRDHDADLLRHAVRVRRRRRGTRHNSRPDSDGQFGQKRPSSPSLRLGRATRSSISRGRTTIPWPRTPCRGSRSLPKGTFAPNSGASPTGDVAAVWREFAGAG